MTTHEAIKEALKNYLKAFYTQDYSTMYDLLYEEDIKHYRDTIVDFAAKMDVFGETEDFLTMLNVDDVEALTSLSLREFMYAIIKLVTREVGEDLVKKMLDEMRITSVDEVENLSIVAYEYPVQIFDNWELMQSDVQMINIEGEWKIFFKSGLEQSLEGFKNEIDLYYERKSRDILDNLKFEGDLIPFTLVGFKDLSTGKVVFEPRFQDAGEFSNGLAYVKVMRKYGYINLQGDIAIKPRFIEAREFSQKRAAVKLGDRNSPWAFINTKGKVVIKPQFEETSNFSEGLCAVKLDGKWGYIDKKGNEVIPFKFDLAGDFDDGVAYVDIDTEEGDAVEFIIDKEGNIKELD